MPTPDPRACRSGRKPLSGGRNCPLQKVLAAGCAALAGVAPASISNAASTAGVAAGLVSSGTTRDLTGIAFAGRERGLAVGRGGTVISTRDGGRTWGAKDSGIPLDLAGVSFPNPTHAYAAGAKGVLVSGDGGASWTLRETPLSRAPSGSLLGRASLNAVSFSGDRHGIAVGADGVVIATSDGGRNWGFHGDPTFGTLTDVSHTGPQRAFVSGVISYSSPPFSFEGPPFPGSGAAHRLLAAMSTNDGGRTWKPHDSDLGGGLLAVSFPDPKHGFVVGQGGKILATADGGKTWTLRRKSNADELYGVDFWDRRTGVASGTVTSGPQAGRGLILVTSDGGRHWAPRILASAGHLRRVAFAGKQTAYAAGANGSIVRIGLSPPARRHGPSPAGGPPAGVVILGVSALAAIGLLLAKKSRG